MTNSLPHGEFRDTNTSAVLAVYRILQRQPWKTMAIATWDAMRRFLHVALIAASLGAMLPTLAHAHSYQVLSTYVPFKFQVGNRTFKPGRYDFIVAGPGIVAMRDEHDQFIASITTRTRTTGGPTTETKLVFNTHTKTAQLIQIWAAKGEPGMDVLGEELVVRPARTVPTNALQPGYEFMLQRPSAPGFKQ